MNNYEEKKQARCGMTLASYLFALCLGAAGGWLVRGAVDRWTRPPIITRCGWCQKLLRWHRADVSDGICPECARKVLEP
jgi:hypothetical protein